MSTNINEIQKVILDGIREIPGLSVQDAHDVVSRLRASRLREIKSRVLADYEPQWMVPEPVISILAAYPGRDPGHESSLKDLTTQIGVAYRITQFCDGTPVCISILQGTPHARAVTILKRLTAVVANMADDWAHWASATPQHAIAPDQFDDIPF